MSAWIPRTATPKSPCVPRKLPLNSANRPHRTPLRTPKRRHGETTRRFSLGCPRFEAELCALTHAVPPLPMQSRHWCATYSGAAHNCRNFIFSRHFPIHKIFERSCEMGLLALSADKVAQIFGTRITRKVRCKVY